MIPARCEDFETGRRTTGFGTSPLDLSVPLSGIPERGGAAGGQLGVGSVSDRARAQKRNNVEAVAESAELKILVVEDEAVLGQAIVQVLRGACEGRVDLARDGESALALMSSNVYELAVLDWSIPPPSGLELLKVWRRTKGTAPVIMLSGFTSDDDRDEVLSQGADEFLTKPFSLVDLRDRARELLQRPSAAA